MAGFTPGDVFPADGPIWPAGPAVIHQRVLLAPPGPGVSFNNLGKTSGFNFVFGPIDHVHMWWLRVVPWQEV